MEIPGYKIQREIGRGDGSRVYLGLQHTFSSPVAIKVLSPEFGSSHADRQRFLAAGQLARGLDHPNIVRTHDVGQAGEVAYLVMEYVRGGDLGQNLRNGLHMQNVLAIVKEVATALGYAHAKGILHGNVKPENILISEQGTSLLADFGLAADSPGTAGAHGTPGYMSPEQLAGQDIDGRADFYSLGVVFYLMLTGQRPFETDLRHGAHPVQDRLPSLALQAKAFEDVISQMLARSPNDRCASALEIGNALDALRGNDSVPNAMIRSEAISTAEIEALGARNEASGGGPDAQRSSRLHRIGTAATIVGILSLATAAAYLGSESGTLQRALAVVGLVENPDVHDAWQDAAALRRDPSQRLGTVVEAYRNVLAIDPRRTDAQTAIDEYARGWKEDIGRLIDQGDLDTARDKLGDLADTFPDDPELTTLSDRLGDRRQAAELLARSIRLVTTSGLDDQRAVDAAIAELKEVLGLHPGNPDAVDWLDRVATHYSGVAEQYAQAGDGPRALDAMKRAERANPTFDGVENVRASVAAAVAQHEEAQAEFDRMLQQAAGLRESGDLVEAIEMYRSVLVIEPDDAVALQGLAGTSSDVRARFESLLENERLSDARSLRDRATLAGIGDDAVEEMRELYDATVKRIDDVARLNDEAESFMQQGYVTGPDPENSAVARVREALLLDADNPDAIRIQSWAATRLADVAEEAYYAGMVEDGLEYLELALAVTPGIDRWRTQRDRWRIEIWRERAAAREDTDGGDRDDP
ncbi:MAG: protein kinase [Gammaproteobacteria bacterium]|nr:protein kinase [Gammaproteobacteria bacterium]